jgi:uncharacterized protein YecE (DUF72 family)
MRLSVGTSGFSYAQWKGPFYPADLPASQMLAWYAQRLPSVEINNTFYRLPRRSVLEGWAAEVPESFRFAIKASQRITHRKRLRDVGDETRYLLDVAQALGSRLGAILFQLPPNLKLDLERLDRFLELLPPTCRAAFEFRHPSWLDPSVLERLRARAYAWVVDDQAEAESPDFLVTAPWAYVRLRRETYEREDLAAWAARIRARDLEEAFVFFKHEDAGAGPRLAAEFVEVAKRLEQRRGPRAAGTVPPEAPSRDREAG